MYVADAPHPWNLTPQEAISIQEELAPKVMIQPPQGNLRLVAGLDTAFHRTGPRCVAAVVLWDIEAQKTLERHVAESECTFPYIPGLLSFREAPALLAALGCLEQTPDVLLLDGHGIAHPRRFGIACHLGLITGLPAIGCAKTRLCGSFQEPPFLKGGWSPLEDSGEVIGTALRTRDGVRCVFVSPGHLMDLDNARRIVLKCSPRYRIPEPIRLADQLARSAALGHEAGDAC